MGVYRALYVIKFLHAEPRLVPIKKLRPPTGSPNLETFTNTNEMDLGKSYFS